MKKFMLVCVMLLSVMITGCGNGHGNGDYHNDNGSGSGDGGYHNDKGEVVEVPEPLTLYLFSFLALLIAARKVRSKK